MAFAIAAHRSSSAVINVTPLIDVLLVLLIIFMVIQPTILRGLDAAIPAPSGAHASTADTPPVLIRVHRAAAALAYEVDGSDLPEADLGARLRDLARRNGRRTFLVDGASSLDYGSVAFAINAAQNAGADQVALLSSGGTSLR